MRGDPWNEQRVELLSKLWAEGMTANVIAERLGGLSRSAVLGKVFRLRLHPVEARKALSKAVVSPNRRRSRRRTVVQPVPRPSRRRMTLLELTNDCCRWPSGDPGTPSFFFCGTPEADFARGMPYCPRHAQIAYPAQRAATAANGPATAIRQFSPSMSAREHLAVIAIIESPRLVPAVQQERR